MNRIEFRWVDSEQSSYGHELQILIDGSNVINKLKDYENRVTDKKNIIGSCSGLHPHYLREQESIYLMLKGEEVKESWHDKAILLFCDCGFPGCWDMTANVSVQENTVIWSDFEQPHRGPDSHEFWDYSAFGPFNFDAAQYLTALEHVRQQATEL